MTMTPRQKLGKARVRTFDYVPYLASYIYSLREQRKPDVETVAVDQNGNLYWNPEFVEQCSIDELAYAVAHEALHLIFAHHVRGSLLLGPSRDKLQLYVLNVAGDLVIEQTLHMMRQHRPAGAVHLGCEVPTLGIKLDFPPNLSMPQYYRLILEQLQQQKQQEQSQASGDGEQGEARPDGSGGDRQPQPKGGARGKDEPGQGPGGGQDIDAPAGGSAADGQPRPYEDRNDGSWETWAGDAAASTAEQAIAAYEQAHGIGSVPGQLKEAIGVRLHPQPDPFDQLRSAVCTSVASPIGGRDFSHRRQSRRQSPGPNDPLLYGRITTMPNAVVIVDTSGSMGNREIKEQCLTVISQGLRKLGTVRVVCADTQLQSRAVVRSLNRFRWEGGGGTSMDAALEQVDREYHPDSIVLVTDAITAWPSHPTRARVVVAYIGKPESSYYRNIPAWCRTVAMTRKEQ